MITYKVFLARVIAQTIVRRSKAGDKGDRLRRPFSERELRKSFDAVVAVLEAAA